MNEANETRGEHEFVALLTEIQLPLLLYVRTLLPGDPAAKDVSQHANATIWQKRSDFQMGTNFRAWAFQIARFEVLNYRKQQARDSRLVFSEELEATIAQELPDGPDQIQRQHEALRHCLGQLKSADRELIMHRYSNAGTLAEFAEQVGRSAGGLKVSLHRLRNALLDCIHRQLRREEPTA